MVRPALALAVGVAMLTTGCAAVADVRARLGAAGESEPVGPVTVRVGVAVPSFGPERQAADGVRDAVAVAVAQATQAQRLPGYVLETVVLDTSVDLAERLQAVNEQLVDDDAVVAVITGVTSQDVRTVVPELADEGSQSVPAVSPADADPRHVVGALPDAPTRPWRTYWTVALDPHPAESGLADYLARVERPSGMLLLDDGSVEATDSVTALQEALEQRGVVVDVVSLAGTRGVARRAAVAVAASSAQPEADDEAGADDPTDPVRAAAGYDGVYVAGSASFLAAVLPVVRGQPTIRLAAAWAPAQPQAARNAVETLAEGAMQGVLVPEAGPSPRAGSTTVAAELASAGVATPPGPFGAAAWDAAQMVLTALEACLPSPPTGSVPREACSATLDVTTVEGVTGSVATNEFGARIGTLAAVGVVRNGRWRQLTG
jgi:ABC-type branched-subunit amino acid transport system substrate-binding protein